MGWQGLQHDGGELLLNLVFWVAVDGRIARDMPCRLYPLDYLSDGALGTKHDKHQLSCPLTRSLYAHGQRCSADLDPREAFSAANRGAD